MNQKKTQTHRRPRNKTGGRKPEERSKGNFQKNRRPHNAHNKTLLPDPKVLQEYEYAVEGSAKTLLEMAEKEQKKRHEWEEAYQRFYKKTQRFGQFFGTIIVLYLIWTVRQLAEQGNNEVAEILAISGFGALVAIGLIAGLLRRPLRRRYRNHKQKRR